MGSSVLVARPNLSKTPHKREHRNDGCPLRFVFQVDVHLSLYREDKRVDANSHRSGTRHLLLPPPTFITDGHRPLESSLTCVPSTPVVLSRKPSCSRKVAFLCPSLEIIRAGLTLQSPTRHYSAAAKHKNKIREFACFGEHYWAVSSQREPTPGHKANM
jgi:hypothetical protein